MSPNQIRSLPWVLPRAIVYLALQASQRQILLNLTTLAF